MTRTLGLQLQVQGVRGYVRISLDEYQPPRPDQVGGVIVCGAFDEQYIRMFGSEGVPVVSVDFWSHNPNVDSVVVDVESDAYTVIDHLAEKGHTSLGFVATGRQERGGDVFEYDPDIWRILDNLRRVCAQRRRIEMRDEWIRLVQDSSRTPTSRPVRGSAEPADRADRAILCFDDGSALPTLKAIEDAGLRCPEDISVISRGIGGRGGRADHPPASATRTCWAARRSNCWSSGCRASAIGPSRWRLPPAWSSARRPGPPRRTIA